MTGSVAVLKRQNNVRSRAYKRTIILRAVFIKKHHIVKFKKKISYIGDLFLSDVDVLNRSSYGKTMQIWLSAPVDLELL